MMDKVAVALSMAIALRTVSKVLLFHGDEAARQDEEDDEALFGIPKPEPLGRGLAPPVRSKSPVLARSNKRKSSIAPPPPPIVHIIPTFDKNLDAAQLRTKLIDADAARRRAMTRVAQLERETETLTKRCEELEKMTMQQQIDKAPQATTATASWIVQKLSMTVLSFHDQQQPRSSLTAAWAAVQALQGRGA